MSPHLATRPTNSSSPSATPTRLHHLDALRGAALLLGVLLHALMPFLPGGGWLVDDVHESWAAAATVGVIHLFRMVLFMLLAGYFGHMVLHRRGARAYLRDRLVRIGLPLVAFWPGLFALMITAVVLHETSRGGQPAPPPDVEPGTAMGLLSLPTMHLWFLLLLMEIALVVVAVRALLVRVLGLERSARMAAWIGGALASPAGVVLVALPYAVALMVQGDAGASITEPYTLVPVAGASIAYGGVFLAGWFLRARSGALARLERRWIPQLAIAIVLSPLALAAPLLAPGAVTAVLAALAGWAWTYGLIGLTARLVHREIPWVRYLADASYWVYLLHFPLLLLVQVPLADLAIPAVVKLVVSLAVVMAVLLASYDLAVRSTWIGAWLNGHRRPRALLGRR